MCSRHSKADAWAFAIYAALGIVSLPQSTHAQRYVESVATAERLFAAHEYEDAAQEFRALRQAGFRSPDLDYNLGICEAHQGHWGRAIAALERARAMAPRDEAISQRLAELRVTMARERAEHEGEVTISGGEDFAELLAAYATREEYAWLFLVSVCLTCLLSLVFLFKVHRKRAISGGWRAAFVVSALLLAFASIGYVVRLGWVSRGYPAIMVTDGGPLCREGDRVRVLDCSEQGCLVLCGGAETRVGRGLFESAVP